MHLKKKYPFQNKNKKFFNDEENDTVKGSLLYTIYNYILGLFNIIKNGIFINKKIYYLNDSIHNFDSILIDSLNSPIIIPIGHSTVLIIYKGITIITDPIFYTPSIFIKRYVNSIPCKELLPKIDYILISHNHPDHLCIKSLKFIKNINPNIKCIIPLENGRFIKKAEIDSFNELSWWQEITFNKGNLKIKFTSLPAKHWSQSWLFDKNDSLWCSWMIELNNYKIYFAGDTAYSTHFSEIQSIYKNIDCALLPIAPYEPETHNLDSHMNIQEAFNAFIDLNSDLFIPIHWGVFNYGLEPIGEPIERITNIMKNNHCIKKLKGKNIGDLIVLEEKPIIIKENLKSKNIKNTNLFK